MKFLTQLIFILQFFFFSVFGIAQTVKKLNDPSIVAQHKRQVFEAWGDWRPYPKYLFGVQTNFAYATVWGWLAPQRNRDYKDGSDIRPLKPTGLEVQRLVELEVQRKEAEKIKIEVDTLYKRNLQDFAHWTSVTSDADPLWLLYYKRMLIPLKEFPANPQNFMQWQLKDDKTYQNMLAFGEIDYLKEQLDLLKDQYDNSRTLDMPRGKRFLMYHETLIGWRKFLKRIRAGDQKNTLYLNYKNLLTFIKSAGSPMPPKNDKEIVESIMTKYKNKF